LVRPKPPNSGQPGANSQPFPQKRELYALCLKKPVLFCTADPWPGINQRRGEHLDQERFELLRREAPGTIIVGHGMKEDKVTAGDAMKRLCPAPFMVM
jgi:hypothetical protein